MTKKSQKQEESENQESENLMETPDAGSNEANSDETLKETVPDLQVQLDELNSKYIRLYSDFDNFRKRTIKEKADLIGSASEVVLKDVLSVLDDFERAIENNEKTEDVQNIRQGFKLIHQKMVALLTGKGLEKMDSKGQIFDPEIHEAVTDIPAGDEMKGKVVDVIESGYKLNGKPIRYAKVVVGK